MENIKHRLLLYCLDIGSNDMRADELMKLSTDDWDEVIQKAIRHGVGPLLYHSLKTLKTDIDIPGNIGSSLQEAYLYYIKRNMELFHALSKILRAMQEQNIPVIVLKGACLAHLVYQDIALRPMHDIDLMIRIEDRFLVEKLMLQLGYKNISLFSKRHLQWENIIRSMAYSSRITTVECHIVIDEFPALDPWENASFAAIASTNTLILGAEELLLHLCVHTDKHVGMELPKLIWWYDIAAVLKHYQGELNWDYVIQISREHKVEEAVHWNLHLVNRDFGEYVPAGVLDQLECNGLNISIDDVLNATRKLKGRYITSSQFSDISKIPSIREKVHYIFARLFPHKEYMIEHYSISRPALVYFYYPVRILLIVLKTLWSFLRLPVYLWNRYISRK